MVGVVVALAVEAAVAVGVVVARDRVGVWIREHVAAEVVVTIVVTKEVARLLVHQDGRVQILHPPYPEHTLRSFVSQAVFPWRQWGRTRKK
jgi:hypothetical protein